MDKYANILSKTRNLGRDGKKRDYAKYLFRVIDFTSPIGELY